jgi:hypothetical protein
MSMPRQSEDQRRASARERLREQLLVRAASAKRESRNLDFKEQFDPDVAGEWCELVKDLVAMANSGGGVIVIGVRNDGKSSRADLKPILNLDPAKVTDLVFSYTGQHFAGFEIAEVRRGRSRAAAIVIQPAEVPMTFSKPGTYQVSARKQKTAFPRGALYVRHGAKSEPALTSDIARIIERHREEMRELMLRNLRRVVEAPADTEVALLRRGGAVDVADVATIQITTDPGAPIYGKLSPDRTHPHRETEVIREVNKRLRPGVKISHFSVQSIRAVHQVDEDTEPVLVHQPKFGSRQFSDAFVDWIVEHIDADPTFLETTRQQYYKLRHS